MQIIFLNQQMTVILCFLLWPLLQTLSALISLLFSNKILNPLHFPFKSFKFEKKGKIYNNIFKIKKWLRYLPDGASVMKKKGFKKKHFKNLSEEYLKKFLIESTRAELSHWLAIFPFWIFGFFTPLNVIWIMLFYAIIVNFPCIIAQRYNRPRIIEYIKNKYKKNLTKNYFI